MRLRTSNSWCRVDFFIFLLFYTSLVSVLRAKWWLGEQQLGPKHDREQTFKRVEGGIHDLVCFLFFAFDFLQASFDKKHRCGYLLKVRAE